MKKILIVASLIAALSGCATTGGSGETEMGFQRPNGNLTLTVDGNGNFVSIKTIATAEVLSDTAAGKEAAVAVAIARGKRNLSEFMSDGIKSDTSIEQIANATHEDNKYAQNVSEKISTNSQALLRGVYLSKQSLEGSTVTVELTVTVQSVKGADSFRRKMAGK